MTTASDWSTATLADVERLLDITLPKSGNTRCVSPAHPDADGSLSIRQQTDGISYRCFGSSCGISGGSIGALLVDAGIAADLSDAGRRWNAHRGVAGAPPTDDVPPPPNPNEVPALDDVIDDITGATLTDAQAQRTTEIVDELAARTGATADAVRALVTPGVQGAKRKPVVVVEGRRADDLDARTAQTLTAASGKHARTLRHGGTVVWYRPAHGDSQRAVVVEGVIDYLTASARLPGWHVVGAAGAQADVTLAVRQLPAGCAVVTLADRDAPATSQRWARQAHAAGYDAVPVDPAALVDDDALLANPKLDLTDIIDAADIDAALTSHITAAHAPADEPAPPPADEDWAEAAMREGMRQRAEREAAGDAPPPPSDDEPPPNGGPPPPGGQTPPPGGNGQPNDLLALIERGIIGIIAVAPVAQTREMHARLAGADFHDTTLGQAYDLICELALAATIDHLHVVETLATAKRRGIPLTTELMNDCLTQGEGDLPHLESHIQIVRSESDARRMRAAFASAHQDVAADAVDDVAARMEAWLAERRATGYHHAPVVDSQQFADEIEADQQAMRDGKGRGAPTGIGGIDVMLGGLKAGHQVVVAGRPGMGKSALATQMLNFAAAAGHPTMFVSLEMSRAEVGARIIAQSSSVTLDLASDPTRRDADTDAAFTAAVDLMRERDMHVADSALAKVEQIVAEAAARIGRRLPHGVLSVDYLQLMDMSHNDNMNLAVGHVSKTLKRAAVREGISVLLLSQLSRAPASRKGNRPELTDMRDSGTIEQDADAVITIYRDDYYHEGKQTTSHEPGIAELTVLKHRHGRTGTVDTRWVGAHVKFESLSDDEQQWLDDDREARRAAAEAARKARRKKSEESS